MRRVLGINGDVGSGKDTLFSLLPPGARRLAFGDALKAEVAGFLSKHDVCYAIRFLIDQGCPLDKLRAVLEETWAVSISGLAYAFLGTVVSNDGRKDIVEKFVHKHGGLHEARRFWQHTPTCEIVPLMHDRREKERFRTLMRWWGTEYRRQRCRDDYWIEEIRKAMAPVPEDALLAITDVRFPNEADFCRHECGGLVVRIDREGTEGTQVHASDTALRDYEFDRVIDNNGTIGDLADQVPGLLYLLDRRGDFVIPAGQDGTLRTEPRVLGSYERDLSPMTADEIAEATRVYRRSMGVE